MVFLMYKYLCSEGGLVLLSQLLHLRRIVRLDALDILPVVLLQCCIALSHGCLNVIGVGNLQLLLKAPQRKRQGKERRE